MPTPAPIPAPVPPPWSPGPAWTLTVHAADGTSPFTISQTPGRPLMIEGDIAFLYPILNRLSILLPPHPN